jgi:acetylornithine deacetylase/succinyl-diaminopimelate desuccinylase-like protein
MTLSPPRGSSAPEHPRPAGARPALDEALGVIHLLASEVGPRRPCSEAEHDAAARLADWLRARGVDTRTEAFGGYSSFGLPYAVLFTASLAGGLLQRSRRRALRRGGHALVLGSVVTAALEGDLRWTPLSDALARRPSLNVVGHIPSAGPARRRVCLGGHLDTTRSGLIFHPRVVRHLPRLLQVPVVSSLALAAAPLLRRLPGGRAVHRAGLGGVLFSLATLAEREIRGEDVQGASDNASGAAVALQLAAECAATPLPHTEVDVLITSCEESGLLGAQAYARHHRLRAAETTFLNFDTVGGDVPLTYILGEGTGALTRPAPPNLVALLDGIAARRPELGLRPAATTPGLPTDATPMRARGWEAITLLAQGETIPHYHQPTDTYENIAPQAVERALETGRELLRTLDAQARRG